MKARLEDAQGVDFPDIIRRQLESSRARYEGDYECPDFSAQFILGSSGIVQEVDVVLYRTTVASEPMFGFLAQQYGWATTYP